MKWVAIFGVTLAMTAAGQGAANAASGAELFVASGCGDCHEVQAPAKAPTLAEQMAKKGPELWYAGSKFQEPWLMDWLVKPTPVRPIVYNSLQTPNPGDHPALAAQQAQAVGAYLMTLSAANMPGVNIKPRKKNAKGRLIFTKRMGCDGCHSAPGRKGKISGGQSGPSFVGAGARLNPNWIYAFLANPTAFKPIMRMPNFTGVMSAKDMKSVAQYVGGF